MIPVKHIPEHGLRSYLTSEGLWRGNKTGEEKSGILTLGCSGVYELAKAELFFIFIFVPLW